MQCPKCNGNMVGDGYTTVLRCENAEELEIYDFYAPDEDPILCDLTQASEAKQIEVLEYLIEDIPMDDPNLF